MSQLVSGLIHSYPLRNSLPCLQSLFSLDLTSLFNWNTKQLFLYVSAEYTNPQGVSSALSCSIRLNTMRHQRVYHVQPSFLQGQTAISSWEHPEFAKPVSAPKYHAYAKVVPRSVPCYHVFSASFSSWRGMTRRKLPWSSRYLTLAMPMVYIDVLYFLSIQLVEALLSEVTEPSTDICFLARFVTM